MGLCLRRRSCSIALRQGVARASGESRAMVESQRARGRAETWRPWIGAVRRPVLAWPSGSADLLRGFAERLRSWALADVAPGRLVPWLAVAFGFGVVLYFTAEHEPALWAAAALTIVACWA